MRVLENVQIEIGNVSTETHDVCSLQSHGRVGQQKQPQSGILNNANYGPISLRRDDIVADVHDLTDLGLNVDILRSVHVHLIPVVVSIVWSCHGSVERQCCLIQDSDIVTHHRHLVQTGLSIESTVISILDIPKHRITNLDSFQVRGSIFQINLSSVNLSQDLSTKFII